MLFIVQNNEIEVALTNSLMLNHSLTHAYSLTHSLLGICHRYFSKKNFFLSQFKQVVCYFVNVCVSEIRWRTRRTCLIDIAYGG